MNRERPSARSCMDTSILNLFGLFARKLGEMEYANPSKAQILNIHIQSILTSRCGTWRCGLVVALAVLGLF